MTCMVTGVVNMPYYPPQETQNRVDAIKKKFEDNDKKVEKPVVIKRSPAFRCDRIVCGKNVTNISPKSKLKWTSAQSDSEVKTTSQPSKLTPIAERFPKSNSENSLPVSGKNDYNVRLISCERNILGQNENVQYSVVNKKRDKSPELPENVRLALQSPLPTGPPPKKPPRIFIHTPKKETVNEARLKLEKIENFILKHEKNGHIIVPRKNGEKVRDGEQSGISKLSCLSECIDVGHSYEKKNGKRSEFFVDNLYSLRRTTSPVVDSCDKTLALKREGNGPVTVSEGASRTVEPIYDQPFRSNEACTEQGNSFRTFGKRPGVTCLKSAAPIVRTESPLHYMCTDLSQPLAVSWRQAETLRVESSRQLPIRVAASTISSQSPPRNSPPLPLIGRPAPPRPTVNPHRSITSSSPPSVDPSTSPQSLRDVRILMNQAFGSPMPDAVSLDSDSGPDTPEDMPSLELVADQKQNGNCSKPQASSPSLNSISNCTDAETLSQLTAKRKIYVKRVSSHLVSADKKAALQSRADNKTSSSPLFESCLLIGLTLTEGENGQKRNLPYVKSFFPPEVQPPPLIEFFCFPDADVWPPPVDRQSPEEQTYSIVLTNEKGERKFGYCRRVLPEGSHFCLPLAYCIISPHRATGFYYRVLQELESRHGSPESNELMMQLYENEFPNPGQSLKLNRILERVTRTSPTRCPENTLPSTMVRRPTDSRLENHDVTQLFRHLTIPVFLKVFSSLLLERKVLLLGNSLSTLSCCIEALQSILYPFSWQHTYVPVLPAHLLELCEAPTPYVIGVLKHSDALESFIMTRFSEGIIVDIEECRVVASCKDESSILPPKLRKSLRSALNMATTSEPASGTTLPDSHKNVVMSEAFLRFFVEVCGHYAHHILPQSDGSKAFQKESFIKAVQSASTQSFLEWFTETAMFHVFIQDREQYDVHDLFWKRSLQHCAEKEKNSAILSKNCRSVNKKVKTLGDRIKDLTTFSK